MIKRKDTGFVQADDYSYYNLLLQKRRDNKKTETLERELQELKTLVSGLINNQNS